MKLLKSVIAVLMIMNATIASAAFEVTELSIKNDDKANARCHVMMGNHINQGEIWVASSDMIIAGQSSFLYLPHINADSGDYIKINCAQDGEVDKALYSSVPHDWVNTICDIPSNNSCKPDNNNDHNKIQVTLPQGFSTAG